MIYMVEHNFAGSEADEAKWNEWYSHHSLYAFRSVPGWRSGQRFVAVGTSGPKYRAMYTLDAANVLESAEYKATTGGRFPDEWRLMITDFHRNLADGVRTPTVPLNMRLVVVDPPASMHDLPAVQKWNVVGLDRSVPWHAVAVLDAASGAELIAKKAHGIEVYRPIFERWEI
jgi:hypothetical protein